jgi:branched-chain amino acid transport system permease protein
MISAVTTLIAKPFERIPAAQRKPLAMVLLLAMAIVLPLILDNDGDTDTMANAMSYAMLALGLNIVVGFAGLLDLGYAAFFAIGAYFYGIFTSYQVLPLWHEWWGPIAALGLVEKINQGGPDLVHFTLSFWLALPLAGLVAAFFGVLFGFPTLRLRGDYLAIVTLGFGEIVPIVARNVDSITNGAAGLNGVQAPKMLMYDSAAGTIHVMSFGVDALPYYYVGIVLVAFLVYVSFRMRDSRIGRAWMAIREDETAASAMGVNLRNYKLLAFAAGAAFAGMTGVFFVAKLQTATPEMFNFNVSSMLIVMVVLGGMGSVWGVVVGAVLLQLMQTWFLPGITELCHTLGDMLNSDLLRAADFVQWTQLFFGIIIVVMMLFRREGLLPATRPMPTLDIRQQSAEVQRGGFVGLDKIGRWDNPPGNALEVKGVTVKFGGLVALNKIDLVVPWGGVVAVIGPNGSGKSTLFNVITGLVEAAEGSIIFAGAELIGLKPHQVLKHGVARTFQNIRLFPNLTVLENVLIGEHARLHTGPVGAVLLTPKVRHEEKRATAWALDILGLFGNRLSPRATQVSSGISYANRRRVEIARALASRPRILLLDEPTAGMDPAETLELAEQVKSLNKIGLTVLLIEHKLDVVTRLADTVVVLDHGDKIAEGLPDVVRRNEAVLTAYLGRSAQSALAGAAKKDTADVGAANG